MFTLTIIFFLLSPLGSLPFSIFGMIFSKTHSKKYLLLFSLSMAIISMHLAPLITDDGTRVLETITKYGYMNFSEFLEVDRVYREPITHFLYFLIGQTDTPKLIFSIGAFIQYFLLFYIVIDYANRINAKIVTRAQVIILILGYHTYFSSVGSFRFYTATAICLLAFYTLTMKDKKVTAIILCLLACMIHSSFYMQLGIIIITLLTWVYSKNTKVVKLGLLFWSLAAGYIMTFLNQSSLTLFKISGEKLNVYSGLDIINYVQLIFIYTGLAMCLLFIYLAYKRTKDENILLEREESIKYYDLLVNFVIFSIGSLFLDQYIFRRLAHMVVLATAIPLLMYSLQKNRTISIFLSNILISIVTIVGFVYSFRILTPKFDIAIGELFIYNIFIFIYELLF